MNRATGDAGTALRGMPAAGLATANPRQPPTAPPPQAGTQPPETPAQSAPISQTQLCGRDTSRESLHMAGMRHMQRVHARHCLRNPPLAQPLAGHYRLGSSILLARSAYLHRDRHESSPTHPLGSPPLPIQRYTLAAHTCCVPIPSELQPAHHPASSSSPISHDLPRSVNSSSSPISPDLPRVRLASNSIHVSALPAVPRGGETGCVPMSVPTL